MESCSILAAVTAIDTSGLDALSELKKVLDKRSIEVQLLADVAAYIYI